MQTRVSKPDGDAVVDIPSSQNTNEPTKQSNEIKEVAATASSKPSGEEATPFKIFAVVAFYFVISISTVFLNKFVMNVSKHKFNQPLSMTWFQLVFALLCIVVTYPLNKVVAALRFLPDLEFKFETAKQILPLTLIYVGMLAFNNLCLNYVDIVFYQVARSLSIVFTVLIGYYMFGETQSQKCLLAIGAVILGYVIGAIGGISDKTTTGRSVYETMLGIVYGLLSSVFVALYGIYVKKKLPLVRGDTWTLLIYNTALAIIVLIPVIAISGEVQAIVKLSFLGEFDFWFFMSLTAFAGYLINIAFFLQIKYTSPLTNTISGTAKACVQTLLGWLMFGEILSFLTFVGTTLCIAASTWYSRIKYVENEEAKKQNQGAKQ
jgi:GDP-fucose transporter C1